MNHHKQARLTRYCFCLMIILSTNACLLNPIIHQLIWPSINKKSYPMYSLFAGILSQSNSNSDSSISFSYGSRTSISLVPDVSFSLTPIVNTTVSEYTISASLPIGISFDTKTGIISGKPSTSYFSNSFALTSYTITASNSVSSAITTLQFQVPASGESIWTVLNGVSGNDTYGGLGSLFFHTATNSLYSGGSTTGSLNGETSPYPTVLTGFATKYDLDGNRIWTRLVPLSTGSFNQSGITLDPSANLIISGTTSFANGGTYDGIALTADSNLGITKFDSDGNKAWTTVKGGTELNSASIVTDSSGNIYSTGSVKNNLDGVTNSGSTDSAVVWIKYSNLGSQVGLPALYGNGVGAVGYHMGGSGIVQDVNDSTYFWIAGYSQSPNTCASGGPQFTIVLFFYNGTSDTYSCTPLTSSSNNSSSGTALTIDPSNNKYMVGYSGSNLDGLAKISNPGYNDAFIAKFNSAGTVVWRNQIAVAGNVNTVANAITRSPDDYYYVTGYTTGNLGGQTLTGTSDLFVAKYDASGTLIWVRLIGASGSITEGHGLAFDTNNTLYVSGKSNGDIGGVTNPVKPNYAHLLIRFVK